MTPTASSKPSASNVLVLASRSRARLIVAAAIAFGTVGWVCASEKPDESVQQPELLRLLRESRAPYDTVATQFVQHKQLSLLDVTLESKGMIFFRRPNAVRYEILSPARSVLLYDGKKVHYYTFSEGRWKLLRSPAAVAIGEVLRQIGRWIQGDFSGDRKMFDLRAEACEKGGGCIYLTPRSKAMAKYIQRVEIHVEKAPDYKVTRVTIRESDVDITKMRFVQELRNHEVPKGTFTLPDASAACLELFGNEDAGDPTEGEKQPS